MAPVDTASRRTVLKTLGTIALGAGVPSTAGASAEKTPPGRCKREAHGTPPAAAAALARDADTYVATVDRIVGGTHLVLLLEDDGDVVDQLVLDAATYPNREEGDVVLLELSDGTVADLRFLRGETKRRRRRARDRLDCLSEEL